MTVFGYHGLLLTIWLALIAILASVFAVVAWRTVRALRREQHRRRDEAYLAKQASRWEAAAQEDPLRASLPGFRGQ